MNNVFCLCLIVMMAVVLNACSPFSPIKSPNINHYRLQQAAKERLSKQASNKTLLVSRPEASAPYQSTQMVYAKKPYQLQAFANNEWIATPSEMLQPLLVQSLRNSHYFHAVVAAPSAIAAELRLDTQILQLQQDFSKKPSRIELVVQANLIDKENKVVASRRFKEIVTARRNNPQAGVFAANQATEKLLRKLAKFVVSNSRKS